MSKETQTISAAEAALKANAAATLALSERVSPKQRAAAAKAAKVDPNRVLGVAERDGGLSIVVATDTGVEKLFVAGKAE